MDFNKLSLEMHEENKGKIEVVSKVRVETKDDLSTAYTPGVAEPCRKIHENPMDVYKYTCKANTIAVVSDGTAVLGLGDIGPLAAIPVMEGKGILFKRFGNVDAFPICLDTKDTDEIVETVKRIAPSFGGINLEDISAPRCFEIEERLKKELDIPVFHDDQYGTAIVCSAGIMNALKLVGKKINEVTAVINGAGAAGISITKLLLSFGLKDAILVDRQGAIYEGRDGLNPAKAEIAKITNKNKEAGSLADVVKGKDIFLGVSAPGVLTKEMVSTMAKDSIIFAMANPTPEIMPDEAKAGGAAVVATGRSDFPWRWTGHGPGRTWFRENPCDNLPGKVAFGKPWGRPIKYPGHYIYQSRSRGNETTVFEADKGQRQSGYIRHLSFRLFHDFALCLPLSGE